MVQVIGAGFGRTGTVSLKLALETLLGGPCYHMYEFLNRRQDAPAWMAGFAGNDVDWAELLAGWSAIVDWPGVACVNELAKAFPDAKILLSTRDPNSWWRSADRTILELVRDVEPGSPSASFMAAMFERSGVDAARAEASIRAYVEHNDRIRSTYGPNRLIEWQPGDGWAPICVGLGVDPLNEPYPHANSFASFADEMERVRDGKVPRNAGSPPDGPSSR